MIKAEKRRHIFKNLKNINHMITNFDSFLRIFFTLQSIFFYFFNGHPSMINLLHNSSGVSFGQPLKTATLRKKLHYCNLVFLKKITIDCGVLLRSPILYHYKYYWSVSIEGQLIWEKILRNYLPC